MKFRKGLQLINGILYKYAPFVVTRAAKEIDTDVKMYFNVFEKLDHVRMMGLNLLVNEIHARNLEGNVAELGVYKGAFARCLNQSFPSKKLYLFDTFEGFSDKDFTENEEAQLKDKVLHDFDDTSVEKVLAIMPFREQCVVKKGLFPETAYDCTDEKFCFVSIDADLYQPIYEGLVFFYERMIPGGYIMIHDYNNKEYKGAKRAVNDFSSKYNVPFVPLPDGWGSAIICKPASH